MLRSLLTLGACSALLLLACGDDESPGASAVSRTAPAAAETSAEEQRASDDAARELLEEPSARTAARGVKLVRVGTFDQPVFVTSPPGDRSRVFVVEQPGTIRVMRSGRKLSRPFLDIRSDVEAGGEQGLLSMAFARDYATSRRFYVYFTGNDGDVRIQEFRTRSATSNTADRGTRRELLRIEHSMFSNHNGGQLQIGPDGLLYAGIGDGGGGGDPFGSGQNLDTLLGKILRIDPTRGSPYAVPGDNPFAGDRRGRGEVYSFGLRNPWRFSFDRATGDLVIADVGQNEIEEVDFVREGRGLGANFGWNRFEGSRRFARGSAPGHIGPVIEHRHPGFCSITGGYIVRDRGLPQLRGRYVYGDFCDGRLRSARLTPTSASSRRTLGVRVSDLSSFGEDGRGRIYATSLGGTVYRLASK